MSAAAEGVRRAEPADVGRLAELAAAAVEELSAGRGGAGWARTTARRAPFEPAFESAIGADDHLVLVGTLDGTPMGYAVARVEALPDGGRLGVIDDLYVDPGAREVGIGEAMIDAILAWCRAEGCFGVDSLALPGDRHTKNFFESFGLVARAIVVHRSLE